MCGLPRAWSALVLAALSGCTGLALGVDSTSLIDPLPDPPVAVTATLPLVAGPELVSRGFVLEGAHQPLLQEARAAILAGLEGISPEGRGDPLEVHESVRRTLKKFFDKRLDRRPMILPFIMEM